LRGFPEAGKHQGSGKTCQLLWEMLTRPGHCQSNSNHPHACKKQPRECERPEREKRAWYVSQGMAWQLARQFTRKGLQRGHSHPTSSRVEFSWWTLPSQKELSYVIHPAESHVLCTHQNECGNPDRGPKKTCSHLGTRLQIVPEPFTGKRWQ